MKALETFKELFELIKEHGESLLSRAADRAKSALEDILFGEVNEELDRLPTHYSVESIHLYDIGIVSLDAYIIRYSCEGGVDCSFQYGSDADVERDDGVVTCDDYPLTCQFMADTATPLAISIVPATLNVYTDRFYGDGRSG